MFEDLKAPNPRDNTTLAAAEEFRAACRDFGLDLVVYHTTAFFQSAPAAPAEIRTLKDLAGFPEDEAIALFAARTNEDVAAPGNKYNLARLIEQWEKAGRKVSGARAVYWLVNEWKTDLERAADFGSLLLNTPKTKAALDEALS